MTFGKILPVLYLFLLLLFQQRAFSQLNEDGTYWCMDLPDGIVITCMNSVCAYKILDGEIGQTVSDACFACYEYAADYFIMGPCPGDENIGSEEEGLTENGEGEEWITQEEDIITFWDPLNPINCPSVLPEIS